MDGILVIMEGSMLSISLLLQWMVALTFCSVYAMALHGNYTTRYDILVGACNFDPNSFSGPSFKFEDVNHYDLGLDTLYVEDEIWVGRNVVITAKVGYYDSYRFLFYLDPISVVGR